ncbi:hypothetical protein [Mycobacteroides abscessus]|uniref:hypothetical protein n=1 Tax=Mycobacteroides abscessus TaxID=36809 RepID=UPI003AB108FE
MTTDTREGLPDWLTVGAKVVQVHDRRHYGQTVITGTVHRILARGVVVLNSEGAELTRFRRTDYVPSNDYFRRRSSSYVYADWVYLYGSRRRRHLPAGPPLCRTKTATSTSSQPPCGAATCNSPPGLDGWNRRHLQGYGVR